MSEHIGRSRPAIKRPTARGLERTFKPYAIELGYLVYAWNRLQDRFGLLFWDLSGIASGRHAFAIWHSVTNDRAQREMLRATIESPMTKFEGESRAKADLLWMVNHANKMADNRNDAIHSPFILNIGRGGTELRSASGGGHPRAEKLKDKDLKVEFRYYADCADVLSEFAEAMHRYLGKVDPTWPDRPLLPHLDRSLNHRPARPRTPAKSRRHLVQFDRT